MVVQSGASTARPESLRRLRHEATATVSRNVVLTDAKRHEFSRAVRATLRAGGCRPVPLLAAPRRLVFASALLYGSCLSLPTTAQRGFDPTPHPNGFALLIAGLASTSFDFASRAMISTSLGWA